MSGFLLYNQRFPYYNNHSVCFMRTHVSHAHGGAASGQDKEMDMRAVGESLVKAGTVEDIQRQGNMVITAGRHGIVLFSHDGTISAVDNRCPHMGFPLSRGSVCDGILTCHWHHARFDLRSGGTFDPFADDVRSYPVQIIDGEVWVDTRPHEGDQLRRWKRRLEDGLEQNLSLVIVKSVLALLDLGVPPADILNIGGTFGTRYRDRGWGPGLTILTALGNVLGTLAPEDQALALYHGLVHVARDCAGEAPRFGLDPLPDTGVSPERLKAWFRQFVEVRDTEGAERTLLTAISAGMSSPTIADMLLAAATDHYFLAGGHTLDFINKACELLDHIGWERASDVLPSLIRGLCQSQRSEEQNAWRHPIDLVALLHDAFKQLPALMERDGGADVAVTTPQSIEPLAELLLGDDPRQSMTALLSALEEGASITTLSQTLAYAAALRVARFHTSNEFGDWITVLHTFTYCNALHQSLRRAPSPELARGIFHGAMKLYLDRFLNMPAAALPSQRVLEREPETSPDLRKKLLELMDREQQVHASAAVTYRHLVQGLPTEPLLATLGHTLLREDAEFHSYQMYEAGITQYGQLQAAQPDASGKVLVAVARYLAAHAPTSRAMLQTARSALRLHRGEELHTVAEGEDSQ